MWPFTVSWTLAKGFDYVLSLLWQFTDAWTSTPSNIFHLFKYFWEVVGEFSNGFMNRPMVSILPGQGCSSVLLSQVASMLSLISALLGTVASQDSVMANTRLKALKLHGYHRLYLCSMGRHRFQPENIW